MYIYLPSDLLGTILLLEEYNEQGIIYCFVGIYLKTELFYSGYNTSANTAVETKATANMATIRTKTRDFILQLFLSRTLPRSEL